MQTALTTVVVMWTPPPEAAVNGYTVRYRLSSGSTSTPINDLTNGETYTFSIAAIASNMLPGVSEEMNITLGEWLYTTAVYSYHSLPLSLYLLHSIS